MVNANAVARTPELARRQRASCPVVSRLTIAVAIRDVACAMAAALLGACLVLAELARSTGESKLAIALSILAYPTIVAEHRTAFHGASLANISCCTVAFPSLAYPIVRAVVGTTRLVAVGTKEVSAVANGAIFATEMSGAVTRPLGSARAVAAAFTITGTDLLCAVLTHPTTLAQTVVVDAASVRRTCLAAQMSGAGFPTPAIFAEARAIQATTMVTALRVA